MEILLDASGPQCRCGLLHEGHWLAARETGDPALQGLFDGLNACLCEAGLALADTERFVFGEGPGSVLGIRIAAMAINAWRATSACRDCPVVAFRSLELAAAYLRDVEGLGGSFAVLAEAKQGKWNALVVDGPEVSPQIILMTPAEVDALTVPKFALPMRATWPREALTGAVKPVVVPMAVVPALLSAGRVPLRPRENLEAFVVEAAVYKTWSGGPHSAEVAP